MSARKLSPLARILLLHLDGKGNCDPIQDDFPRHGMKSIARALREIAPVLRLEGAAEEFDKMARANDALEAEWTKKSKAKKITVGMSMHFTLEAGRYRALGDWARSNAVRLRAQASALRDGDGREGDVGVKGEDDANT